jgi:hypothetical protein
MTIPTLTTERLILRAPTIADFPAYEALMASPRAVYMGGPFDQRAAWGMFTSDLAMWSLYGHGALMIDLRETGECVGQVGINHGPLFPEKELGWVLYEGLRAGATPPKPVPPCAIGPWRPSASRPSSAISTPKTTPPWQCPPASVACAMTTPPCRTPATSSIATL